MCWIAPAPKRFKDRYILLERNFANTFKCGIQIIAGEFSSLYGGACKAFWIVLKVAFAIRKGNAAGRTHRNTKAALIYSSNRPATAPSAPPPCAP